MNEFSSEDMALVQSGFELHDDSPKHADTDMFLYQAMQDIYEVLKVISEENKLATLAYEEHVKKNPKKVDDKEGKASIAQNQEGMLNSKYRFRSILSRIMYILLSESRGIRKLYIFF